MKFKLSKKIITSIGLSFLLASPLILSSCGSSNVATIPTSELSSIVALGWDASSGSNYPAIGQENVYGETISALYEKYGEQIYYKDSNNLWTLDLSKLTGLTYIRSFSLGLFEKEINRLILPNNNKNFNGGDIFIDYAAFYPNTNNGFLWAKKGINPMFKAIDKPIALQKYSGDKYYFNLDLSNIYVDNPLYLFRKNQPKQIFPIDTFDYDFTSSGGWIQSPGLPLNLSANANYLKNFVTQDKIDIVKEKVKTEKGNLAGGESNVYSYYAFPFGHSPVLSSYLKRYYPSETWSTSNLLQPIVVSHPYLFKYILFKMCEFQLTSNNNSSGRDIYKTANNFFSNNGNELTISFMNQFTENSNSKEIINLGLGQNAIVQILNYDFNSTTNDTSSLTPEAVNLLNQWNTKYGMYDINNPSLIHN